MKLDQGEERVEGVEGRGEGEGEGTSFHKVTP